MIVVTGGAGFIGSNLVKALNEKGHENILVVDDLTDGRKFRNMVDLKILDYLDKGEFLKRIQYGFYAEDSIEVIFHQGACSTTTEWDGQFMMENNYEYSKELLHFCQGNDIPFLYASSAAVYGGNSTFVEEPEFELPLNVYGYSKLLFDQYVRQFAKQSDAQITGFRYFNVYGPREQHKDGMASVAFHVNNQCKDTGVLKLFAGTDGYGDGEQRRDFVYVRDVVDVNIWCWENQVSGIYNVGTGRSQPFNDVATAVRDWHGRGEIEYIPFPEKLKGCYQSYTQADISALRAAGYEQPFKTVAEGVKAYLDLLNQ